MCLPSCWSPGSQQAPLELGDGRRAAIFLLQPPASLQDRRFVRCAGAVDSVTAGWSLSCKLDVIMSWQQQFKETKVQKVTDFLLEFQGLKVNRSSGLLAMHVSLLLLCSSRADNSFLP